MTTEQTKRTKQALTETRIALNKALSYTPKFQDEKMIEFYRGHISKLENMIAGTV